MKNIYRSGLHMTFELCGYFRCLQALCSKLNYIYYILSYSVDFKLTGSFEIHWVRQCLVNFTGVVGIVNTIVYKTETILIGLGHGQLSWFLTLNLHVNESLIKRRRVSECKNLIETEIDTAKASIEPRSLARQCWHGTAAPLSQLYTFHNMVFSVIVQYSAVPL